MKTKFSKLMAALLCVMMLVSSIPTAVFAATSFSNAQLSVVTEKASMLATGVTQNAYTVYDKNGDQVKMYVTTADMNVDTVELFASYKDMNPTNYGMSKLTEQVAAFNNKVAAGDEYYQGTVVAGINASYYNMTTGKPTGTFVMNGIDVTTESEGNAYGYFAVMKDGSVKIGKPGEYSSDKGNIQEAIGIYHMLIVDGEIVSGLDATKKYPRQTIGITEDNKVILMTADGNQAPATVGLTIQEQAQVMLDLGCVWAGHLDGGGSATYASKPEGSDSFVITNSPSDGSERSVSNGFIIVSTEAASNAFNRVMFTVENEYVTPGTSVAVTTTGVSSTGNSAEIPAEITYETTNGTYVDGVFTAGETAGDATITAMYNGEAVGETTIHVVVPDKLVFNQTDMVVPYGKTVTVNVTATYGLNKVVLKDGDVNFALTEDTTIGTFDFFDFTAATEEATTSVSSEVVATLTHNPEVTATAIITLGKGSEVVADFESGKLDENYTITTGYPQYGPSGANGQNEIGELEIVTAENGKVHDGNYALAVECDYTQPYETGYHRLELKGLNIDVPANAQTIGMWLYVPELEELSTTSMRFIGQTEGSTSNDVFSPWLWDNCEPYGWSNDGWRYVSMDISSYDKNMTIKNIQLYICDRDNSDVGFYFKDHASVNSKFTYYIDNITLDYSSAVDDREAPVFSSVHYADTSMSDAVELKGQTVNNNVISFSANVNEDTSKSNYTGLDASTAKVFIDGVAVNYNYSDGNISVQDVVLSDGVHTVRFEICDNMGNMAYVTRQINIAANSGMSKVSLVPANPDADKILIGSLYWMNVVASDIEKIDSVTMNLNLNSVSQWELDHMNVATGFTAEYVIDDVTNNAEIIITRVGENESTGEAVLAELPIRTWESRLTEYKGYEDQTPAKLWSRKIIWPIDIKLSAYKGIVEFCDGTTGSFSMKPISVITELYGNYGELNENGDYANKTSWHIHSADNLEDKAATCTEDGYTGRTFCETCNSVVEWGTTIKANGHAYDFVDGVLKCACGKTFTGIWNDGKEYINGILVGAGEGGWVGDSYYVEGVKLTGINKVPAADGSGEFYYNFGDDGICNGQVKFTGLFYDEEAEAYRYSKLGELAGGWHQVDDEWHYFRSYTKTAVTGEYTVNGVTYQFDETGMTKGAWSTSEAGTRYYYGPTYYVAREPGYKTLIEIDGKTYNFDNDGYITIGTFALRDSTAFKKEVYEFGADGAMIRQITNQGLITTSDNSIYYINEDGIVPMDAGLVKVGDDYCYVVYSGKVKVNEELFVSEEKANGLLPEGTYTFGEDGKMTTVINGIDSDGYYRVDGVIKGSAGLIKLDDAYYYVVYSGKIVKNVDRYISEEMTNGLLPAGTYTFGEDGKMTTVINGVGSDGYYRENGVIQGGAGLIKLDDAYYYVVYSGKVVKNVDRYIPEEMTNGLLPAGTYTFGEDGKMTTVINGVGEDGYYRENGMIQGGVGLIKLDDAYYYVVYSGKVVKNVDRYIPEEMTNGLLPAGTYTFGEDGKMTTVINGVDSDGYYRENGVIQGGAGLIKLDGAYYYVVYSGKVVKNVDRYIPEEMTNGLLPAGIYTFGEDGKMIQ